MKMRLVNIKSWAIIVLLFISVGIFAQHGQRLAGKVIDEQGEPLVGVSVSTVVNGKTYGTTTNFDGTFTLIMKEPADYLVFSYIGYDRRKFVFNEKTALGNIVVKMNESKNVLDQLVVVGYGTLRKSDVNGSSSTLKPNEIEASTAPSIESLMQGRIAGMQVMSSDGAPGAGMDVYLRGAGGLTATPPLYVVDGVIMNSPEDNLKMDNSSTNEDENGYESSQNVLLGINPQDIETFEVLKDASATAIYGSMGANGVVLITTKSGKSPRPKITYTGNSSIAWYNSKIRNMALGFDEYADWYNYKSEQRGITYPYGYPMDKSLVIPYNWMDLYTNSNALSQSHRLSISGKTDFTSYLVAGGFSTNKGMLGKSYTNDMDFRLNLDQEVNKYIKTGVRATLTRKDIRSVPGGGSDLNGYGNITYALANPPLLGRTTSTDTDGNIVTDDDDDEEELLSTSSASYNMLNDFSDFSRRYSIVASTYLNIQLAKDFSMRTTLGVNYNNNRRQQWRGANFAGRIIGGVWTPNPTNAKVNFVTGESSSYNINHMFSYRFTRNRHRMSIDWGAEFINSQSTGFSIAPTGFLANNLSGKEQGMMYAQNASIPYFLIGRTLTLSGISRAVYTYKDRYSVTGTFRVDGSSKFVGKNQYKSFPSLAFGYRIDQEPYFKENFHSISSLKARLGWGLTGNQGVAAYADRQNFNTIKIPNPDGSVSTAYFPSNIPNRKLKWSTSEQYNGGVDFGMFSERLTGTVDLYLKKTKDMLQNLTVANSTGFSTIPINRGLIQNKGLEITLNGEAVRSKDFSFSINGNISFNQNKILNLGVGTAQVGAHVLPGYIASTTGSGNARLYSVMVEGYPVAQFFGMKMDGIVQKEDALQDRAVRTANFLARNPNRDPASITLSDLTTVTGTLPLYGSGETLTSTPSLAAAGDPNYVDANGDGIVDLRDRTFIGNPMPDFNYGFGFTLRYKKLSMNAVFYGQHGNQVANADRIKTEYTTNSSVMNITKWRWENMYREDRPSNTAPRMDYNSLGATGSPFLSLLVEDGSFLRFSTLTFSYRHDFKTNFPIRGIAINATIRNLYCWSNYTGFDPEVSSFSGNLTRAGISWGAYPRSQSFSLGLTADL